jgi:hypothetical protein
MSREQVPPGRGRAGAICLVGGAVLLAAGRALALAGGSPAQRLQQVDGHQVQAAASVILAVAGFAALIPGFLAVAAQVRGRGARLATIGAGLCVAGFTGFVALVTVDAATAAAGRVGSARPMEDYLHQLDMSPAILAITPIAVLGYFFGPFLLTLGTRRAGQVPRWLPWGVLVSLVVQPLGAALGGPWVAHVLDTLLQLLLVGMVLVLARHTLLAAPTSARPSSAPALDGRR